MKSEISLSLDLNRSINRDQYDTQIKQLDMMLKEIKKTVTF